MAWRKYRVRLSGCGSNRQASVIYCEPRPLDFAAFHRPTIRCSSRFALPLELRDWPIFSRNPFGHPWVSEPGMCYFSWHCKKVMMIGQAWFSVISLLSATRTRPSWGPMSRLESLPPQLRQQMLIKFIYRWNFGLKLRILFLNSLKAVNPSSMGFGMNFGRRLKVS